MDVLVVERRQIENEMIFRRTNEKIGIGLDEIDANNVEDGNPQLVRRDDLLIEFMCECSDENCHARVPIKLSVYQKIHLSRNSFVIKNGHQVKSIEKVAHNEKSYTVVKKNKSVTEPGKVLNVTSPQNT